MAMKRKEETPPRGAPAWQATYGDMVTLLLTFFIMLYAMSDTNVEKTKAIMMSMKSYTGSTGVLKGGSSYKDGGVLLGSGVLPLPSYDAVLSDQILGTKNGEVAAAQEQEVQSIAESVSQALSGQSSANQSTEAQITEAILESSLAGQTLDSLVSSENIAEAIGAAADMATANGKTLEELIGGKTVEDLVGDKTLDELIGEQSVEEMINNEQENAAGKTIEELLGGETVQDLLGNITMDDLSGNKTLEELIGEGQLQGASESEALGELIAGLTINDLIGDTTLEELVGGKTLDDLSGQKLMEELLGGKTIEELVGGMTAEDLLGNKSMEELIGNVSVDALTGNKTLEELLGNKTIENLAGNKEEANEIKEQTASEYLGASKLEELFENNKTADEFMGNKTNDDLTGNINIEEGLSDKVSVEAGEGFVKITFDNGVLFDSGTATLKQEAYAILKSLYSTLKDLEKTNEILIEGHTDNVPINTSRYPSNWYLSSDRALAVLSYYVDLGISPTCISATGYGEFYPIASNDTAEGRSKNRRVEIKILSKYNTGEKE